MKNSGSSSDLMALAEHLVEYGKVQGADEIEVSIIDSTEFNVEVRFGEIENLVEAGARHLSLRVIKEKKSAFATSSDLNQSTLENLVKNAVKRSALANPDEYAGLPNDTGERISAESLNLYDPAIPELPAQDKINLALKTEEIALDDPRINNSHGSSVATKDINIILMNSKGFSGSYRETFCSLGVGLQAGETDNKVEDFWASSKRHFHELESPEEVAAKAVARTVRQLGPKKIKTQKAPVIFEPLMTSWLLGFLFSCISGVSVYQKTSFLAGMLGEKIAGENITVIDDGLMPGKFGTTPFDSEGVASQITTVIQSGLLKHYLCNTYAAKKLGLRSTGNADGSSVGPGNFYLQAGAQSPEEIIASLDKGLILTRTLGHGLNPVTGDISRGAFGLWVEDGEIAHAVSEITISGNLGSILKEVESIGNDLDFLTAVSGPTIKIKELTLAGE